MSPPGGVHHYGVLAGLGLEDVPHELHGGRLVTHQPAGGQVTRGHVTRWSGVQVAKPHLSSVCLGLEVRSQLLPLT